jgi:hypothetical protein
MCRLLLMCFVVMTACVQTPQARHARNRDLGITAAGAAAFVVGAVLGLSVVAHDDPNDAAAPFAGTMILGGGIMVLVGGGLLIHDLAMSDGK